VCDNKIYVHKQINIQNPQESFTIVEVLDTNDNIKGNIKIRLMVNINNINALCLMY